MIQFQRIWIFGLKIKEKNNAAAYDSKTVEPSICSKFWSVQRIQVLYSKEYFTNALVHYGMANNSKSSIDLNEWKEFLPVKSGE